MAEDGNEPKKKRGSVKEADKPRIIEMITGYRRMHPLRKIPWEPFARALNITDTAGKPVKGRKLLESWNNYIDPELDLSPFNEQEWTTLISYYIRAKDQGRISASGYYQLPLDERGNPLKWVGLMHRRSPNVIKNLYYSGPFIKAGNETIANIERKVKNPVVFPTGMMPPPSNEASIARDDSDEAALQPSFLEGDAPLEESRSVPRSGYAPQSMPFSGYDYAPPPMPSSPFVNRFFDDQSGTESPGGAGAATEYGYYPYPYTSSASLERSGGNASRKYRKYRKYKKSARKYKISARKSRKMTRRK